MHQVEEGGASDRVTQGKETFVYQTIHTLALGYTLVVLVELVMKVI